MFVYAVRLRNIRLIFYVFYKNCVNMNVSGVFYRNWDMLKFDKFRNENITASKIRGQLVSFLSN